MAKQPPIQFNCSTSARKCIVDLVAYRCARDEHPDDGTRIFLDGNENAFGPGLDDVKITEQYKSLNRYPDPYQIEVKKLLCQLRQSQKPETEQDTPPLTVQNLFVGSGSDEAIDLLIRCFCNPGTDDSILICPPTYGMYSVCALVNDVSVINVPLLSETFQLDVPAIKNVLREKSATIKAVFVTSPGNPTGTLLNLEDIKDLLQVDFNGLIVLDEAYIDFAGPNASLAPQVNNYKNLVVLQTLSKAFGLASIRLGVAYTSFEIAAILNKMKFPYNVPGPSLAIAEKALHPDRGLPITYQHVALLKKQRDRLASGLLGLEGIGRIRGGFDANFLLVQIVDLSRRPDNKVAKQVYEAMAQLRRVVVRFRGNEVNCEACLRITVGTEEETTAVLKELEYVMSQLKSQQHIQDKQSPT